MYCPKRWHLRSTGEVYAGGSADISAAAMELAGRMKIAPLIAQVLLNRNITGPEQAGRFLAPSLKDLIDPALLPGLPRASQRIAQAIRDGQEIVIYGDYDVDGITATSILWHAIRKLGGRVRTYIPHRVEEGYGLNADALKQVIDEGAKLIVTVDCGVTAVDPARVAKEREVDLIITDHHDWHAATPGGAPMLPDCYAVVHPRLPAEVAYGNPYLCGAGVAFKLAWGIGQAVAGTPRVSQEFREFLVEFTGLAALGTIADVVPLVGENRVLAHHGLHWLPECKLPGIVALLESAALTGKVLEGYHVSFILGPRLNAAGRLSHAQEAVDLLTTADAARAAEIVPKLEEQNRARRATEADILKQALEQIEAKGWSSDSYRALVVDGAGWHAGVIGIVAARLVERFNRPTFVIALPNPGESPEITRGQGSGRSIAGFHLARALESCSDLLIGPGGHEMAAGLKIEPGNVEAFRHAFLEYAQTRVTDDMMQPRLELDCIADVRQLTEAVVRDLQRVGPFGPGNPKPLIGLPRATLTAPPRCVGRDGKTLQLTVSQEGRSIRCVAFGMAEIADRLQAGTEVDLAGEPMLNEYGGRVSVQFRVSDVHFDAG